MAQWQLALVVAVSIAIGFLVGSGFRKSVREAETAHRVVEANRRWQDKVDSALYQSREHGVRYGVLFSDWGDLSIRGMRWRWTVWDADRFLVLVARNNVNALAPEGFETPFMLGNAATRPLAEAEALAWIVAQQDATAEIVIEKGGDRA
jgi:hypothetical protein